MNFAQFLEYMIDGDEGAAVAIQAMMADDKPRTVRVLRTLDELDIRGKFLWECYMSVAHLDVKLLFRKIEDRSIVTILEGSNWGYKKP